MRRFFVLLCVLVIAAAVPDPKLKPDAPDNVKAYVQACIANKPVAIARATEWLKVCQGNLSRAQSGKVNTKLNSTTLNGNTITFTSLEEKNDAISKEKGRVQKAQERVKALQAGDVLVAPPELSPDLKVGQIGSVEQFHVVQIIDKQNMLAKPLVTHTEQQAYTKKKIQVVTESNELVWVQDFDTAGLTDKSLTEKECVVEVVGTKKYDTAMGSSSTVLLVKPFQIKPYLAE